MLVREIKQGRSLLARLDHDGDIMIQIIELAKKEGIQTCIFSAIGALTQAKIAIYDQKSHEYNEILLDEPMELLSFTGNISVRDGSPFVHAHVVLTGSDHQVRGGHLIQGKIFAAELYLVELLGKPLIRKRDLVTGLHLWSVE
jgi:predicted DNA-binding protein with PD1-like motif